MSYTLRDAQHLCWKTFHKINEKSAASQDKKQTPITVATDLLEKAGKANIIVKELEDFRFAEKPQAKHALATELSDLLYVIFVLAENYGINLEESFLETVNDYMLRFIK